MFNGEESIRIPDQGGDDKTFDFVERHLDTLGRVRASERGYLKINPRSSFDGALTKTTMDGTVRKRRNGEYEVVVSFNCTLNTGGWVILVLGVLFLLLGVAVLIAPAMHKNEVAKKVSRALQELESE